MFYLKKTVLPMKRNSSDLHSDHFSPGPLKNLGYLWQRINI